MVVARMAGDGLKPPQVAEGSRFGNGAQNHVPSSIVKKPFNNIQRSPRSQPGLGLQIRYMPPCVAALRAHHARQEREKRLTRSEEHTSELQSHSFISYAVF